jgi:signal transduction histidine kinase
MNPGARISPQGESAPSHTTTDHPDATLRTAVFASPDLLHSRGAEQVVPAVVRLAGERLGTDAHAVWRWNGCAWHLHAFAGVSEQFAQQAVAHWNAAESGRTAADAAVIEDLHTWAPDEDARIYVEEGVRSMLALPLTDGATRSALLVLYARQRRTFAATDVQWAQALGRLGAVALEAGGTEEDQRRRREQASFLAQASAALADSLDLEITLETVARLAVPGIADSCAIHLTEESGEIRLVAAVHIDPLKAVAMRTLANPETSAPSRIWLRTIREGVSALLADIDETAIQRSLQGDPQLLDAFDQVRFTSQISVPLRARGRTIGGITFTLGPGARRYDQADLRLAEDLAQRAALAVENARAYKQASDANRLKDEFLGTLSHELRTPLNAILGYARMLRGGVLVDPAKRTRALEILERNAQALTEMVEDVLDVSRIMAGKMRLQMQETNLAHLLEHAVATILPAADAKQVRFRTTLGQTPPVWGDPERLQQLVCNLLVNAVKFTPAGGSVRVELQPAGHAAEITVQDTGQGIAPEFLPHVFERFRQADSRFSRQHGGLGLGLAPAREIAQSHGGSIHAVSEGEGRGATFTLRLPLLAGRAAVEASAADRPAQPMIATPGALHGLRVLVVDDDEDARGLVQTIIEEAGGQVVTACSAAEALRMLDAMVPDVMVSDLGMPGMDGLELIRAVRARTDAARQVPAVALTSYARSEDRLTALRSGFQRHLAKPVDHLQLVAAILALGGATPV